MIYKYKEALDRTIEERDDTEDPEKYIDLEERAIALREARDRTLKHRQLEEIRSEQEEDIGRLQSLKGGLKRICLVSLHFA